MAENSRQIDSNWIVRLYEQESARLILYGRALGLSLDEAEDVLQETFLALIKLETSPSQPLNYCLRSFRNRALNLKRNLWRRVKHEFELLLFFKLNSTAEEWFFHSTNENDVEYDNLSELVTKALKSIPLEQREVIVLKIWHNLTFEQIAECLNISPNTAAGRYRYGLEKLKKIFCDYECKIKQFEGYGENIGYAPTIATLIKSSRSYN
ncbi:MAG: RNA polymerase sigma factor [Verrucomicrobiae bacterium]|nr:RNA polymerase sigma factor [Verrucomicrobiae bacterium]